MNWAWLADETLDKLDGECAGSRAHREICDPSGTGIQDGEGGEGCDDGIGLQRKGQQSDCGKFYLLDGQTWSRKSARAETAADPTLIVIVHTLRSPAKSKCKAVQVRSR